MTECVIAMPVLLLLFLACWYFQKAYAAKLDALSAAREEAWTVRDDPDECYADGTLGLASLGDDVAIAGDTSMPASEGALEGSSGYGSTASHFRYARTRRDVARAAAVPRILDEEDGEIEVRARVVTTCNEPPPPDFHGLMVDIFWDWVSL